MRQRFIQSFSTSGTEHEAIDNELLGRPYVAYIRDGQYIDWDTLSPAPPVPPEPDYSQIPLTFEIISGGTINWSTKNPIKWNRSLNYKINDGEWVTIETGYSTKTIDVSAGDIVQFTANTSSFATSAQTEYTTFDGSTAIFRIYGNIMSIIWGNTFRIHTDFRADTTNIFRRLFQETDSAKKDNIVDISNLVLPATTLVDSCYSKMFYGRSSITKVTCLATDISALDCTSDWLYNAASSGTFVKHPNTIWPSGASGIPLNWTVENADI